MPGAARWSWPLLAAAVAVRGTGDPAAHRRLRADRRGPRGPPAQRRRRVDRRRDARRRHRPGSARRSRGRLPVADRRARDPVRRRTDRSGPCWSWSWPLSAPYAWRAPACRRRRVARAVDAVGGRGALRVRARAGHDRPGRAGRRPGGGTAALGGRAPRARHRRLARRGRFGRLARAGRCRQPWRGRSPRSPPVSWRPSRGAASDRPQFGRWSLLAALSSRMVGRGTCWESRVRRRPERPRGPRDSVGGAP